MKAVLLSGGIDSIAIAYWQRPEVAVTIDYGQLAAAAEIRAASSVAKELSLEHRIIQVDCRQLGRGQMARKRQVTGAPSPVWWPYRNQLLVTLAAMQLVGAGVDELMIGCVRGDDLHSDGREDFFRAIDQLLQMQEFSLRLTAPAIGMTTVELVHKSRVPQDILAWAHSCHCGELACGTCRGCRRHRETFRCLGFPEY